MVPSLGNGHEARAVPSSAVHRPWGSRGSAGQGPELGVCFLGFWKLVMELKEMPAQCPEDTHMGRGAEGGSGCAHVNQATAAHRETTGAAL